MINHISKLISDANVNIAQMLNRSRGDYAVSLVDIDQTSPDMLAFLKESFWKIDQVLRVRLINNPGPAINFSTSKSSRKS
jgi:D-3-phosphoglycerate dehydrogenase